MVGPWPRSAKVPPALLSLTETAVLAFRLRSGAKQGYRMIVVWRVLSVSKVIWATTILIGRTPVRHPEEVWGLRLTAGLGEKLISLARNTENEIRSQLILLHVSVE